MSLKRKKRWIDKLKPRIPTNEYPTMFLAVTSETQFMSNTIT